jgi:hypothetical protein
MFSRGKSRVPPSVADPGSGAFLTPGSEIRDMSTSFVTFFVADIFLQ